MQRPLSDLTVMSTRAAHLVPGDHHLYAANELAMETRSMDKPVLYKVPRDGEKNDEASRDLYAIARGAFIHSHRCPHVTEQVQPSLKQL